MKYLEELSFGDCFIYNDNKYILTTDFKNNFQKLCVSLKDGHMKWIKSDQIVDIIDIFIFDKESNVIAIKERKKQDDFFDKN